MQASTSFITIKFPFPYRAVSPYLQSDQGTWTVLVTTEGRDAWTIPVQRASMTDLLARAIHTCGLASSISYRCRRSTSRVPSIAS